MTRGQGRVFRRVWKDKDGRIRHGKVWHLEFSLGGIQYRQSSKTSNRKDALAMLAQLMGDYRSGRMVGNPQKVKLSDLRALLKQHYETQGHKSLGRAMKAFDHLEETFLPGTRALDVSRARVAAYIEQRLKRGYARDSVKYEISILNSAFGLAVESELLSVYPGFKLPAGSPARQGFFEEAELETFVAAAPTEIKPLFEFMALVGWRSTECRLLKWDAIDWEAEEIRLEVTETKNKAIRIFPFGSAPRLKELIEERWKAKDSEFVFSWNHKEFGTGSLAYHWRQTCKLTGIERMPHDLRRTVSRRMIRAGIPEGVVLSLLGWVGNSAMLKRYGVVSQADKVEAVERLFNSTNSEQTPEKQGNTSSV
jgi:integrase